jgi:hypothetical protein
LQWRRQPQGERWLLEAQLPLKAGGWPTVLADDLQLASIDENDADPAGAVEAARSFGPMPRAAWAGSKG